MISRIASAAALALAASLGGCDQEASDYETAYASAKSQSAQGGEARTAEMGLAAGDQAQGRQGKKWDKAPEMQIDTAKTYFATIRTNMGDIKLELFDDAAPKTVNNFVFLAKNDFYDGTIFHRVIDNFMLQGGDPTGTGMGDPGYKFEDEFRGNPHKHEPFTMSMANSGPNTNGSQFFITEGATPHLDGRHTVFGRVIEGKEVVTKIASVQTSGPPRDRPREEVKIEDVVIEEKEGAPTTRPSTRPAGE